MHTAPQVRLTAAAPGRWMRRGWEDFRRTPWIGGGFALIVAGIGGLSVIVLMRGGLTLVSFPLLSGFMLIAPVLVIGYYHAADLLRKGDRPTFGDLLYGFRHAGTGLWVIALILAFFFLIWLTDALLLYALLFGTEAELSALRVWSDPLIATHVAYFLLFGGIVGFALAFAIFAISVFSIPLVFHGRYPVVSAIVLSVRIVFGNLPVMMNWAAMLAGLTLFSLFVFMPLFAIVFPVLAYASYEAYRDVFGDID